ncbi:HD domain-containing protein [Paludibacterium paludis]|uniref:Hydrolase n=1 Tax=Paludibacterium paludis TaxID=1225769 RepID=A0A918P751_9NEIS|nr:HD domain-containing protein [Paludibacterium paludis]GGY28522.1 hydrolase [Paludibacterium paludis]
MPHTAIDWRPRLLAILAAQPQDADGSHDINHFDRVWNTARQLMATAPGADTEIVIAACYLHDLVNLPKNHPERHLASRRSASLARVLLAEAGYPAAKLDAVAHAIEAHSFSANIEPITLEAQIVQDADRLDALGMIGIARLFYIAGRLGHRLAHPDDPLALARELDDTAYSLDHIVVKLAGLPDRMRTEAGRRLGWERLETVMAFREAFAKEWHPDGIEP